MVPVGGSIVVVLVVPVVPAVAVPVSRLKAVPWRNPETTAWACSSPPRNVANSALNFDSTFVEVPMVVVVVVVVLVPAALTAGAAAARQNASSTDCVRR